MWWAEWIVRVGGCTLTSVETISAETPQEKVASSGEVNGWTLELLVKITVFQYEA